MVNSTIDYKIISFHLVLLEIRINMNYSKINENKKKISNIINISRDHTWGDNTILRRQRQRQFFKIKF